MAKQSAPTPTSHRSVDEIIAHRRELEAEQKRVDAQIAEARYAGKFTIDRLPRDQIKEGAKALLNGYGSTFAARTGTEIDLGALELRQAQLAEAITFLEQFEIETRHKEAQARLEQHGPAYRKAMHDIAMAVFGLERALQARDAMIKQIKPVTPLSGTGFPFLGRLSAHAGPAYTFAQIAVAEGWIDATEFERELAAAHRAMEAK